MIKHPCIITFCKNFYYSVIFLAAILLLYACPFSSPYKLDKDALIPVDDVILGKWATRTMNKKGDMQPIKMMLTKKNDTEYNISFTGDLSDLKSYKIVTEDSIKGSAYMSIVADRPFLNVEIKGQTYISALIYKNDTLSLMPLKDGFTAKYIKSDEELRLAVKVHCKTRVFPMFDEQFCLIDMVRVN